MSDWKCRRLHLFSMACIHLNNIHLHITLWDIDWMRLYRIHSFTLLSTNYSTMSCDIKKKTRHMNINRLYVCLYVTLCLYEVYLLYDVKCINLTLQYWTLSDWGHGCSPRMSWFRTWSTMASSTVLPLYPPTCILTLLFLSCWPCLFPDCSSLSEFVILRCARSIYPSQMKLHDMRLWAILENWLIIGWFSPLHFPSLVEKKV